jgi:hypothetical protein
LTGGVFANDPISIALPVVIGQLKIPIESIRVISIGSGVLKNQFLSQLHQNWGMVQWIPKFLNLHYDGMQKLTEMNALHLLGKDQYLRVNPTLEKQILLHDLKQINKIKEIALSYSVDSSLEWIRQNW